MNFHEYLNRANDRACPDAREWAEGKTWEEVYATCHRGDWLCWLFARTNPDDLQALTLVKGLQANEVRHLMRDPRSTAAVETAIKFGEGKINADAAVYAAADAAAAAAYAAAYAAADAAYAAADAAAAAAYAAADAARKKSLSRAADIFRENIPYEKINRTWETM